MHSFQPFTSGGGQSSHMQTPETTPLRKRENDSFASPEAPLLWRQPLQPANGALLNHNNTYSPSLTAASSVYFPHMTRRRGRHDNRHGAQFWIPWIMKAILASPLVVLVVWFVVVAFHHPDSSSSSTMKNNRYGMTAKNPRNLLQQQQNIQLQQRTPHKQHPGKDKILPVYVPMGMNEQQQQISQGLQLQESVMQGAQNPQLLPQNGFTQQLQPQMMQQPQQLLQQPQLMQQQQQQQQPVQMVQVPQQQIILPGQNMMQLTTQQQPGQLYQQHQQHQQQQPGQFYQQQQPLQQPFMMQQAQPLMQQAQPQLLYQNQMQSQQQLQQPTNQQQVEEQTNLMTATRANHKQNQRPAHPSRWGNLRGNRKPPAKGSTQGSSTEHLPKVYYYDPAQAVVQGQLQAPSVVYDEHGNEVKLASLVSDLTDLYIEPPVSHEMAFPVYGSSQSSGNNNNANRRLISSSNSTVSNSTVPILPIPPPPPLEMKIKRPDSWGESTTQDQSIIVCTVATMALLVGALSARRLRSRSFLSSCIENESLEDEVAFDSAYTVTGGDSYNTFGWKGDLEKFDV